LLDVETAGEAIERLGIDRFREAETRALAQALDEKVGIISLGGGSPTAPGAAALLEAAAKAGDRIVYLHAPPRELSARLLADEINNRPSLSELAPVQEVQALYEQRDPLYRALATRVIQIAGRPPEQVAAIIRVFEAS
jgi:shikimate kinase